MLRTRRWRCPRLGAAHAPEWSAAMVSFNAPPLLSNLSRRRSAQHRLMMMRADALLDFSRSLLLLMTHPAVLLVHNVARYPCNINSCTYSLRAHFKISCI